MCIQLYEPSTTSSNPTSVSLSLLRFSSSSLSPCHTLENVSHLVERDMEHTEAGLSRVDPSELQPSKRLKSSIKLHSAEFYDSLFKVWLTRRALKELNRRTSQVNSLQQPPPRVDPEETSPEETSKQRRFARHGGPELCDLRGVRLELPKLALYF